MFKYLRLPKSCHQCDTCSSSGSGDDCEWMTIGATYAEVNGELLTKDAHNGFDITVCFSSTSFLFVISLIFFHFPDLLPCLHLEVLT